MTPRATPGDIEWIDTYGHARICGHQIHKTDILALEKTGDRRDDGHLTAVAKGRIAAGLTRRLQERDAQAEAAFYRHTKLSCGESATDEPPA